jgi:hypothetical protein
MARKRAPGGGRKPKGPVPARSQLTVRMPDDVRAELEAAARRRNRNLTDEVIGRIRASFVRDYEQKRDPATRALLFLISQLAEQIHMNSPIEWHQNPFMFKAFKLAVARLLDALEPSGKVQSPMAEVARGYLEVARGTKEKPAPVLAQSQWFGDAHETPEKTAMVVADGILRHFFAGSLNEHLPHLRDLAVKHPENEIFRALSDNLERDHYRMSDARRALQLKPKSQKKEN